VSYLKTKRDANHNDVARWLECHGCEVLQLMQPLDLLVINNDKVTSWVEVKIPGSRACFTRKQLEYISRTKFNVVITTDPAEALAAMREKQWLTDFQKLGLAALLAFNNKKDKFTPNEVNQAIGKKQ
jgi:hypothetical protein